MKKLKLTKVIASLLTVVSILALNPIGASAEWRKDNTGSCWYNTGWWYTEGNSYAKGWRPIDGKWYYFYDDGYMAHDTAIDGYVISTEGTWVKDTTPEEEEYFKNLASQNIYNIDSSEKFVFDGCYTKENYPYRHVLGSMNINDNIIYQYEICPKNGQMESEPSKIIIGKDSKNVYEANGGFNFYRWKNKQKIETFKYID